MFVSEGPGKRWRVTAGLLACFVFGGSRAAEDSDLLAYTLPALTESAPPLDLATLRGRPVVLLFFEPGCHWCLKQMEVLSELAKPYNLRVVAVGVHGTPRELRRWAGRSASSFPLTIATPELLDAVRGIPATPYLLMTDERGRLTRRFRGFANCTTLQLVLEPIVNATLESKHQCHKAWTEIDVPPPI